MPCLSCHVNVLRYTWKVYEHVLAHHMPAYLRAAKAGELPAPGDLSSAFIETTNSQVKTGMKQHSSQQGGHVNSAAQNSEDVAQVMRLMSVQQHPQVRQLYYSPKPYHCSVCGAPKKGHMCPAKVMSTEQARQRMMDEVYQIPNMRPIRLVFPQLASVQLPAAKNPPAARQAAAGRPPRTPRAPTPPVTPPAPTAEGWAALQVAAIRASFIEHVASVRADLGGNGTEQHELDSLGTFVDRVCIPEVPMVVIISALLSWPKHAAEVIRQLQCRGRAE